MRRAAIVAASPVSRYLQSADPYLCWAFLTHGTDSIQGTVAEEGIAMSENTHAQAAPEEESAESSARASGEEDPAARRLQVFLAMLAHELRNPLAPMRNAVQIMQFDAQVDPRTAWARDVLNRQINQLARLVDALLDVSRITNGKIILIREPLCVTTIVTHAIEACQPILDEREQQLTISLGDQPPWVLGDLTRLVQSMVNLLSNASQFTPTGGRISINVRQLDDNVELAVRDTGVGITQELLPSIFELFVQGEPLSGRSSSGLGVGLTLTREIVNLHGGSIAATSAGLNRGSEFTLQLPVYRKSDPPSRSVDESQGPRLAVSHRILVVDDNRDSAETMEMLLQLSGHIVRTAYDGTSALPIVSEFQPDVILLDLGLPGLTGYEVAERVQQMILGRRPLLVAMTGYGQQGDRQRTREAGFDHHLVKPVDLEVLQQILSSVTAREA